MSCTIIIQQSSQPTPTLNNISWHLHSIIIKINKINLENNSFLGFILDRSRGLGSLGDESEGGHCCCCSRRWGVYGSGFGGVLVSRSGLLLPVVLHLLDVALDQPADLRGVNFPGFVVTNLEVR